MRKEAIFEEWSPALGASVLTDEGVAEAQKRLGFILPAADLDLLKVQNGGFLKPNRIPLGYDGIDAEQDGRVLNLFLREQWGYPEHSLVICHDRHGGFALQSESGDTVVVYCDAERYPPYVNHIRVADSFEGFVSKIDFEEFHLAEG